MDIAVLLQQLSEKEFRVTSVSPAAVTEGPTREAALEKMKAELSKQFAVGEVVRLHIPTPNENPWLRMAGQMVGHPDAAEIAENMREYRRQVDSDPDRL